MINKYFKQKNKGREVLSMSKGFTLVETLIAISIFTVSILGMLSVLAQGISNTTYAKQKIAAAYLTQEGIEYVRNMRDNYVLYNGNAQIGWNDFTDAIVGQSYPITDSDFNLFTRTITATQVTPDEIRVYSTVSWQQGSGSQSISFSEDLFNWVQ